MTRFAPPGPLGMGGAPLGNLLAAVPEDVALATIDAALDCGIRHFDTAPFYGFGLSEHRMGHALRARPQADFVLSTKVGRLLDPAPSLTDAERFGFHAGLKFTPRFDYSADGAHRSLEASLQRLGLASVDIAYVHDAAEDTHGPGWREHFHAAMHGAAPALTALREQGVIRAWGLGVNGIETCLMALERADPDVFLLAGRYTLLDTRALDTLFPACAARGASVVLGGPYNSGLLAGGTTFDYVAAPPALVEKVRRMAAICARHGVDLKAAALQFCAAHPVVAAVIPGARTPAEMRQNAALMQAPIPADLWQEMKHAALIPAHAPTPG